MPHCEFIYHIRAAIEYYNRPVPSRIKYLTYRKLRNQDIFKL